MNAREIAMKLLEEFHCDLWCYQDDYDNALKDINSLIENDGRQFSVTAEEIANALVEIARENPKPEEPMKRFTMVYDGDSFIDGIDYETLEEATDSAIETLILWEQEEYHDWEFDEKGNPIPTEEQIENWDYMIYNLGVWVDEKDDDGNVIERHYLTDEQQEEIGWMLWEDWKKKYFKN